jgi:hypothetical protein
MTDHNAADTNTRVYIYFKIINIYAALFLNSKPIIDETGNVLLNVTLRRAGEMVFVVGKNQHYKLRMCLSH